MRSPSPALIQSRAKGQLETLEVLHLSNARVECLRNLDRCEVLRSLYADNNRIRDLYDLPHFQYLWMIDLRFNKLQDVHALSRFSSLGFVYLDNNFLSFEDIACLRNVSILELRLENNPNLCRGKQKLEYVKKVIALLPHVWVLDGHYIPFEARLNAVDEYQEFVKQIVGMTMDRSKASSLKSCTSRWNECNPDRFSNSAKLAEILQYLPERDPIARETYRLQALIKFYNEEAAFYNRHRRLTTVKTVKITRKVPIVHLKDIQLLPLDIKLKMAVLLATWIEYDLNRHLVIEALTIFLLEASDAASRIAEDTTSLPPYAVSAVVGVLQEEFLNGLQSSNEYDNSQKALWKSIPFPLSNLLKEGNAYDVLSASTDRADRCAYTIKLLSNASSFPDPASLENPHRRTKATDIKLAFKSLLLCLQDARSSTNYPVQDVIGNYSISPIDYTLFSGCVQGEEYLSDESTFENYEEFPSSLLVTSRSAPTLGRHPKVYECPKPGDRIEISSNRYLTVLSVSLDQERVTVGTSLLQKPEMNVNTSMMLSSTCIRRNPRNIWFLHEASSEVMEQVHKLTIAANVHSVAGKLHRESLAYHRQGHPRNSETLNYDIRQADVQDMIYEEPTATVQSLRQLEIYSSGASAHPNYVLASAPVVSAQNFVGKKIDIAAAQRLRWDPIDESKYEVLEAQGSQQEHKAATGNNLAMLGTKTTTDVAYEEYLKVMDGGGQRDEKEDDWMSIKEGLQIVLQRSSSRSGTSSTPSLPLASDRLSQLCDQYTYTNTRFKKSWLRKRRKSSLEKQSDKQQWHLVPPKHTPLVDTRPLLEQQKLGSQRLQRQPVVSTMQHQVDPMKKVTTAFLPSL